MNSVEFVELVTRALEERNTNQRMVRFAIVALSQLYFEPKCRLEFERCKPRLLKVLAFVIETTEANDQETWRSAMVFKASLDDKPKTQAPAAPKLRSVVGSFRAFGKKDSGPASAKSQVVKKDQHVFISYQWAHQVFAKTLEKQLRDAGYKTWFDLNDMTDNVVDSMVYAVERAFAVVVLFSRK
jgi:hypothetical protein